jgi:hypothetical protein
MKHLLMTTTCCFLRLSKVRIFLSAANHTKNAALGGDLVLHTLFQGKPLPSTLDKALKIFNFKSFFFGRNTTIYLESPFE